MAHQVTGALAVVRDRGGRAHYLYQGGLVPPGLAADEELERLEGLGLLTEVPDVAAVLDEDPNDVPPPSSVPTPPGTAPAPVRPQKVANRGVWEDYVVDAAEHHGDESMTRERAQDMTKDDLIAWQPEHPTG